MMRQPGYTAINVVGLAIGLATCTLIVRYIQSEFSVDSWQSKGDRIYRVLRETRSAGGVHRDAGTSGALASAIEQDFPEVEKAIRVWQGFSDLQFDGEWTSLGLVIADTTVFRAFDYSFVRGSVETSFPDPSAMVLTESTAKRIFGDRDPLGQTLTLKSRHYFGDFTITGILRDIPRNTTLRFEAMITRPSSWGALEAWDAWYPIFTWRPVRTYVLLHEGASLDNLRTKLSSLIGKHMGPDIAKNNDYLLQPFRDIYLYSGRDFDVWGGSDIRRLYQFVAIAALVLAIACINFTNLATARSARRAGEVGLRKVTGAQRSQLIGQFLGESVVTSLLALILAYVIARLAIGDFNAFFDEQISLDVIDEPLLGIVLLGIGISVGLVAGAYPALYLSSFQPFETLKGTFRAGLRGQTIRKALVVAQFTISIVLIVGTGVIYQQIQYLTTRNLGYNTEQLVTLPIFSTDQNQARMDAVKLADRYRVIKRTFLSHPTVIEASAYRWLMGWSGGMIRSVEAEGHEGTDWRMRVLEVDEDYLDLFDLEMVSGRKFDPVRFPADTSTAFILNETAARVLGWDDTESGVTTAIGKFFKWEDPRRNRAGHVIGVVKDFHYGRLHNPIGPVAMIIRSAQFSNLALRVRTENMDETLSFLEKTWKRFAPENRGFRYTFWDQQVEQMYRDESRVQSLTLLSSCVAILLACMGLFGLASYATEERRKEIGVRKTLGASTSGVVALVSREFIIMVLFAAVLAIPAAWYITRGWLDNFAYRTDLGPLVFILGAGAALTVAQLTVTFHAYRAARMDPVLALRDE